MNREQQRRVVLRHAFVFLFVAPLLGIGVATLPHPRAWLAAHLSAFMTSFVLAIVGLSWREFHLTDRQAAIAFWSGLVAAYSGLVANIFAALVDLPGPASSPGVPAPMPQAAVFYALLAIIVPSTLLAFGVVLFGMRGAVTR
jgi:hypothetical protein